MTARSLPWHRKLALFLRIWIEVGIVWLTLHRRPLPDAVRRLGDTPRRTRARLAPNRYGYLVGRALDAGPLQPRCLLRALVLFRELRRQGDDPELVIGLPIQAVDKEAHAWVELDGHDVGPPPGRGIHEPLVRYR